MQGTATPTAGASGGGGGINLILKEVPGPDPNPRRLYVDLAGPADFLKVRLYTTAMVCVRDREIDGPFAAGWQAAALPGGFLDGLANGVYYLTASSTRGGLEKPGPGPVSLYVLK